LAGLRPLGLVGILSGWQSLRELKRFAIRHHAALNQALGTDLKRPPTDGGGGAYGLRPTASTLPRCRTTPMRTERRLPKPSMTPASTTSAVQRELLPAAHGAGGRLPPDECRRSLLRSSEGTNLPDTTMLANSSSTPARSLPMQRFQSTVTGATPPGHSGPNRLLTSSPRRCLAAPVQRCWPRCALWP
jgi:hypothetical protein